MEFLSLVKLSIYSYSFYYFRVFVQTANYFFKHRSFFRNFFSKLVALFILRFFVLYTLLLPAFTCNSLFGVKSFVYFAQLSINSVLFTLLLLGAVAFFTLLERKVIASVQRREGPNTAGPYGLLQPILDGVKLIFKDINSSYESSEDAFDLAPVWSFTSSFVCWSVIPINLSVGSLIESDYSLLLFLAISSIGIYGLFAAGWASRSKYALMGGVRGVAQYISYEIFFSLLFIPFLIFSSPDLVSIWERQANTTFFYAFFPLLVIFFITMLVETNRAPFDLPEAEAELVAGFNVEYSSSAFALFFLGEYNSMILASTLVAILFLGGDSIGVFLSEALSEYFSILNLVYILKILFFCYMFIFVRANFPRVRYDQLQVLGWKVCLPLSLSLVYFYVSMAISTNILL